MEDPCDNSQDAGYTVQQPQTLSSLEEAVQHHSSGVLSHVDQVVYMSRCMRSTMAVGVVRILLQ